MMNENEEITIESESFTNLPLVTDFETTTTAITTTVVTYTEKDLTIISELTAIKTLLAAFFFLFVICKISGLLKTFLTF